MKMKDCLLFFTGYLTLLSIIGLLNLGTTDPMECIILFAGICPGQYSMSCQILCPLPKICQ